MDVLGKVVVGIAAAVASGVLVGGLSRALMAVVGLAAHGASSFSWSGTSFILLLYVLVVVPGAVMAAVGPRRLRWVLPAAGALFLCVPAVGVASEEVGSTTGFGLAQWTVVGIACAGLFGLIAVLPVLTLRVVDGALGRWSHQVGEVATPAVPR